MTLQKRNFISTVKRGDRRILAKAITLIESSHPHHRIVARHLIEMALPLSGRAIRVGITGVPGAGKSTFIESFGTLFTGLGHRVAVLAVDPSSKRSGGSILADKTRMEKLSVDPGAFIRPSPSGDTLGGVTRMTRETMLLCEAAGFDIILVETVGVGQSETTVAGMVDFFLVLMITGAGDSLQGIKKGILELADAVAINKADGDNKERAERTQKELAFAMHLLQPAIGHLAAPGGHLQRADHGGSGRPLATDPETQPEPHRFRRAPGEPEAAGPAMDDVHAGRAAQGSFQQLTRHPGTDCRPMRR